MLYRKRVERSDGMLLVWNKIVIGQKLWFLIEALAVVVSLLAQLNQ